MKNDIKLLVESLIDDFEDTLGIDYDDILFSDSIIKSSIPKNLQKCTNTDEAVTYLTVKYNIINALTRGLDTYVLTLLDICKKYKDIQSRLLDGIKRIAFSVFKQNTDLPYMLDSGFSNNIMKLREIPKILFNIDVLPCDEQITYRKKPVTNIYGIYLIPAGAYNLPKTRVLYLLILTGTDAKKSFLDAYNNTIDKEQILYNVLHNSILASCNINRIIEENTCTGKIYKVTQKDIDRMQKCIDTGKFSALDLITSKDKMAARIAALYICTSKHNKPIPTEFKDTDLLNIFTTSESRMISKDLVIYNNYINIFSYLVKFPDLHMNDIYATYNEYKNKF